MDSRRLEIRLPADHPIFLVPAGQRGIVAKEWMHVGKTLLDVGSVLTQIMSKLDSMAREINEIKSKQVVVSQEGQGLAVVIDEPIQEVIEGGFKIPTEVISAFDNWGTDK